MKALLVDSNRFRRRAVVQRLRSAGFKVVEEPDMLGAQGLLISGNKFDYVICAESVEETGVVQDEKNGRAFLTQMKKLHPRIKVSMLSDDFSL